MQEHVQYHKDGTIWAKGKMANGVPHRLLGVVSQRRNQAGLGLLHERRALLLFSPSSLGACGLICVGYLR
jgi:hypothetical protein